MDKFVKKRRALYRKIEASRGSVVLAYVTGDRRGMETQIHSEVLDLLADHLDAIHPVKKITLLLYTRGGSTLAAWSLMNLLRMFADEIEILVPAKAHSAGTLMCLGADRVLLTKQATLGPIDPSLQGPLNPQIPGAPPGARVPVSVESVKGYLELARQELGVKGEEHLAHLLAALSEKIHPLVLGDVFRSRAQIQYLAKQLLGHQGVAKEQIEGIVSFLCSESGSHDYTMNRREALRLGLRIEKPDEDLYQLVRAFHATVREEFVLDAPFNTNSQLGANPTATYTCVRIILESLLGGAHAFTSEGVLTKMQIPGPGGILQDAVSDSRTFEGWRRR